MKQSQYAESNGISSSFLMAGLLLTTSLSLNCGFGGGLYEAGMASSENRLGASLTPPAQSGDGDYWQMENDIRLFHRASGNKGAPNIIFVHGGPGIPPAVIPPGLEALGKDYRIQHYHQRGCGLSSRPFDRMNGGYYDNMQELVRRLGLRAQIADIERIRRILGEERIILVGHSFGGFIAALYAAEFPDRVERLVLVAPAGVVRMPPPSEGLYEIVRTKLSEKRRAEFDEYLNRLFDFRNVFRHSEKELTALQNEFIPYYREAIAAAGLPPLPAISRPEWFGGWSVMAVYFDLGQHSDLTPMLRQIRAKTLLIYGDRDLSGEASFQDYRNIPGISYRSMNGVGHFPFFERPEEFSGLILEFLIGKK
jgi:proline iminopeptidase